ncbi:hypothetical protein HanXRQr2_Chr05g0203971 [Helianthus annuus]|uniref:Uncharacterized protein n=1 Tax=Helianthus annuus TaxID=4232 RepID=A0A9K3IXR9_HELAN|nr:hypothetical protein HanXRQr2_Chr05g0203971 [Helianthus annuus]KAJ0921876.1 hypothetical protein HanPSC8_Chr05g0196811 [Helianthus annuus]
MPNRSDHHPSLVFFQIERERAIETRSETIRLHHHHHQYHLCHRPLLLIHLVFLKQLLRGCDDR